MYSSSFATIAFANAGSFTCSSISMSSTLSATLRSSSKSAASASGSWKGWPSASIIETPPSGMNNAVGPVAADSFEAIRRPSSAFSSCVVRISVIDGLWTYRLRSSKRSGTESRAPKLTMSRAPTETT